MEDARRGCLEKMPGGFGEMTLEVFGLVRSEGGCEKVREVSMDEN
jgi:hypothetical protein